MNGYVFRFIAHKTPDNDRCKKFDRQRIEIKTYGSSPENLKALEGETVEYKWLFKLPNDFKVSKNFTHMHQIKAVGGPYESTPMITLTARKGSSDQSDRYELRYTSTDNQITIKSADLDLLKGHWIEATEIITYGNAGSYSIELKRVSNGSTVLSYSDDSMDTWQDGAKFSRTKWGIYRSLKKSEDLQDEMVLFNGFSIYEIPTLTAEALEKQADKKQLVADSKKHIIDFKNASAEDYDDLKLFDNAGNEVEIEIEKRLKKYKLEVSDLSSGIYYLVFTKAKRTVKVLKCSVE